MQKLILELEVVTPLFLSGASALHAELRPPTIKNLMRFWYRAAKGEVSDMLTESKEFHLFGSTGNSSNFIPRIPHRKLAKITPTSLSRDEYRNFDPGIKYLAFPFRPILDKKNSSKPIFIERSKIDPHNNFPFALNFLPGVNDEDQKNIIASLWLLIFLGGVGSRSRRGFGSLRVKSNSVQETFGLDFSFTKRHQDFPEFFQKNLALALDIIGFSRSPKSVQDLKFTTLASYQSKIFFWKKPFDYAQDALDQAGLLLQKFRSHLEGRNKDDYSSVKSFLIHQKTPPTQYKRAAFGLPVNIKYGSLKYEETSEAIVGGGLKNAENENEDHDRRSSPLFIKVIKINERQYALLFLYLPAQLFPDGEILKITATNGHEGKEYCELPDFNIVEDFLNKKVAPKSAEISF